MQTPTQRSKQDSPSQATDYSAELGLQLLQTNKDEQAQEEYRLLTAKFRRWPHKLCHLWLILGFMISLAAELFIIYTIWDAASKTISFEEIILFGQLITPEIGILLSSYGCGQMLYAIKERKSKIAQLGLSKLQYSMIISTFYVCLFIWGIGFERFFSDRYGVLGFFTLVIVPISNLAAGYAMVKVFRECEKSARENTCDASQVSEETNPMVKDFLKQNEVLEEEISKYDEKLNRLGVKVYRCWLRLMAIFEIVRTVGFLLFVAAENETELWRISVLIGFLLSTFMGIYSCFQMDRAIAKKFVRSSEKAVLVLKVYVGVAIISYLLILKWQKERSAAESEGKKLGDQVPLNLWLFGCCALVPVVTLLGALKVHKILKERDDYAKFYSMPNFSSNL